jgi:hypothetical protein
VRTLLLMMIGAAASSGCIQEQGTPPVPATASNTQLISARTDLAILTQAFARLRMDTSSTSPACFADPASVASRTAPAACGHHLPSCRTSSPGDLCWGGPYVSSVSRDPWGHDYVVKYDAGTTMINVVSKGPDGQLGTADDVTGEQ